METTKNIETIARAVRDAINANADISTEDGFADTMTALGLATAHVLHVATSFDGGPLHQFRNAIGARIAGDNVATWLAYPDEMAKAFVDE